jgi:3-dehydroquinate dehydratase II
VTGKVNVINGPNLGRLGKRQPEVYSEAELLGWIHQAADDGEPVVLNAGALTHTSVALRDACAELRAPLIEVHISNVHAREEFRHHSYLSAVATGVIVGLGVQGYLLALRYLASGD